MGSCCSCTHWLRPRNSPPPAAFGLLYEGAIGQPRWTTSLCNPLETLNIKRLQKGLYKLLDFSSALSPEDPDNKKIKGSTIPCSKDSLQSSFSIPFSECHMCWIQSHVLDTIYNRITTDLANAGQYGTGQDQFDFPCQY